MKEKNRIEYIDIAKFIAMTCVIFGHKISSIPDFGALLWPFHLPIFFIIAGIFLSVKDDLKTFVSKKFFALIVPYYITCALIIVLSIPFSIIRGISIKDELIKWIIAALYGMGHDVLLPNGVTIPQIGAIWFLWAMFFSVILVRVMVGLNEGIKVFLLFACLMFAMYSPRIIWLPLSIQSACFAVPFVYIGYMFKENKKSITEFYLGNKVFVFGFCAFVGLWGWRNFDGFSVNLCNMGNKPIDIIIACADTVIIILVSKFLNQKMKFLAGPCEMFGKMTIVMLSVHIIELNLVPWWMIIDKFNISNPVIYEMILGIISYCCILLITFIFILIKSLRKKIAA
ncbi:Fucose 4-O-acetylase [Lachnospiraceae bacterium]|nr:Fucose 4-O-acetylase [Lachnospiraceae bacterium]